MLGEPLLDTQERASIFERAFRKARENPRHALTVAVHCVSFLSQVVLRASRKARENPRHALIVAVHCVSFLSQVVLLVLSCWMGLGVILLCTSASLIVSTCICGYAAYAMSAPGVLGRGVLPLKAQPLWKRVVLLIPFALLQWVVVVFATAEQKVILVQGKFSCKPVIGIIEGILSSFSILYTHWFYDVKVGGIAFGNGGLRPAFGAHAPTFVTCAWIGVVSAGMGLLELDLRLSKSLRREWRPSAYSFLHWLFRAVELGMRVPHVAFFVVLFARGSYALGAALLVPEFLFSLLPVVAFSGVRNTHLALMLCVLGSTVVNVFFFVDEPASYPAAHKISHIISLKYFLESAAAAVLLFAVFDFVTFEGKHPWSITISIISSIMYWSLWGWLSFPDKPIWRRLRFPQRPRPLLDPSKSIFVACKQGDLDMYNEVRGLVDVNAYDLDGMTPLMHAVRGGHGKVCKRLLRDGARTDLPALGGPPCHKWFFGCKGRGRVRGTVLEMAEAMGDRGLLDLDPADPRATQVQQVIHLVPMGLASSTLTSSSGMFSRFFKPQTLSSPPPTKSFRHEDLTHLQLCDGQGRSIGFSAQAALEAFVQKDDAVPMPRRFREAIVGSGAYGVVCRVRCLHPAASGGAADSAPGGSVPGGSAPGAAIRAVKMVKARVENEDEAKMLQDLTEVQAACAVCRKPHPSLVGVIEIHAFRECTLTTMELLAERNLKDQVHLARKNPRGWVENYSPPPGARRWIAEVFLGMEHVHRRLGQLLRDLKPANVGMTADGEAGHAKILDFGNHRLTEASYGGYKADGVPPCTEAFVSPELIQQWPYDRRTDFYSFGALLWVVFTGGHDDAAPRCSTTTRTENSFNELRINYDDWRNLRHDILHQRPQLPEDAKRLALALTRESSLERPDHHEIRQSGFMREQKLPDADASVDDVEYWIEHGHVRQVQQPPSPSSP